MERGFEYIGEVSRPTVVGLIEARLRDLQLEKERVLAQIPPEKIPESEGYSEVQAIVARIAFLQEALQMLRLYDGAISSNRHAVDYFRAVIDQIRNMTPEYEQNTGSVGLGVSTAILGDITFILKQYQARD